MSTTSQDSYCTAWKPGCRGLWAALCHVKHINPWLWRFFFFFFFFKHTQAVQHANNRNQFKPHSFIRQPGPAISSPMACLAAVLPSEMGDKCVCQCEGERERERELQRKGLNESSGEEKRKKGRGERAGRQGTGRNVVAACQLLIRALVCPLWVRKRDWQCKCSHHHVHAHRRAHLSLWMSALLPGTSQQIKDKTCTLQPPTTKPSITGLPLKSSVQTNTWKKQNTLLFLHMCVFYWTIA